MHNVAAEFHQYNVPVWLWGLLAFAFICFGVIEMIHMKKDHKIGMKEAVRWSVFYVAIGVAFGIPIWLSLGGQAAGEYYAAYSIEKALSLDNLFVMGLIFVSFKVDGSLLRRMLNYGIFGAIVLRGIFIMLGLELLKASPYVGIVFGLILLNGAWKAFKEARGGNDVEEEVKYKDGRIWRFLERHLRFHHEFDGHKMMTSVNGVRMFTLMLPVIILIEATDVMFAFDSVPAVLSVCPDRFIAYSSNLFAIMGLRALFFVYQALADKFWALSWGLAAVLTWIAVKMIGAPLGLHIGIPISLSVLGVLLIGSILLSVLLPREKPIPDIDIDGDHQPGVEVESSEPEAELVK